MPLFLLSNKFYCVCLFKAAINTEVFVTKVLPRHVTCNYSNSYIALGL